MSNKKVLSQAKAKLNSAKAPAKPKDIIYDPMGQWKFPGLPTRIPSSNITMQDVPFPVMAYPNIGQPILMQPGGEYNFPNADYVDEYPQMRRGGLKKGKTSRNPFAINKAFAKHQAFRKPRKNVIFDPKSPNFQDGGFIMDLTDDKIKKYVDGGYIVEELDTMANGGSSGCPSGYYWNGKKCVKIPSNAFVTDNESEYNFRKAAYTDSSDLHKLSLNVKNYPGTKPVIKEKYDEIEEWQNKQPTYSFDEISYQADKKAKKVKDFEHYVYDVNKKENEKKFEENIGKNFNTNYEDLEKFEKILPDGKIKMPIILYKNKPDWSQGYTIYDPKTSSTRFYYDNKLKDVYSNKIKPSEIEYYADDKPDYSNVISVSSVNQNFTNGQLVKSSDSKKEFVSPFWMTDRIERYPKPIQPVILSKPYPKKEQQYDKKAEEVQTVIEPVREAIDIPQQLPLLPPTLIDTSKQQLQGEYQEDLPPQYQMPGYKVERPGFYMASPHSGQLIPHQRFIPTTITKPTVVSKALQKFTGYNPEYSEGYVSEDGYVPGEFENAETQNRRINFQGASSLKDLKAQKEYNKAYDEYEAKKRYKQMMGNALAMGFKQKGGFIETELTEDEIQAYKDGGYIVEDISVPELNYQDGGEPELKQDLQEQVVYGNEAKRKLQGSLIDKYNQAKGAYQDYRENAGLTKQRLKNEGASSIGVLQGQIKEYKNQLEEEKKTYDKAQKALNVLQKKDPKNWKDKKLKDVMSSQGVDALRDLYSKGEISEATHRDFYNNFGQVFDRETKTTSEEDQKKLEKSWYGDGRWMDNPMNVAKVAKVAPYAALAAAGAPAVLPILANPLVQAGLTGYGVYDAATNSIPQAFKDFKKGDYKGAAWNAGMAALDLAPIPLFGTNLIDDASRAGKYLTTQTPLKNAYKINPFALKEAQETMLVRARPVGQDPYINMAEQIRAKEAAGEPLTWYQRNLMNPQSNPQMAAREKYFGQWFADNPSDLDFYINPGTRNFADDAQIEILKTRLPKSEAAKYSVKNFDDAKQLSNLHDSEYILPKDMVQSLERVPVEDLGKLQMEYKQMNTPHWLRGHKPVEVPKQLPGSPSISSVDDVGRGVKSNSGTLNAGVSPELIKNAVGPSNKVGANILDQMYIPPFFNKTLNKISPLNYVPGYGKKLEGAVKPLGNVINKNIKNGNLVEQKGIIGQAKDLVGKGVDQPITTKLNRSNADIYSASFNDKAGIYSDITFGDPLKQGVIGRTFNKKNALTPLQSKRTGNALSEIPLTDSGVALNRRLPFSNRYVPIDKQKLLNNEFQWATTGAGLQNVGEKFVKSIPTYGLIGGGLGALTYNPRDYFSEEELERIDNENIDINTIKDVPTRTDVFKEDFQESISSPQEFLSQPDPYGAATIGSLFFDYKKGGIVTELSMKEIKKLIAQGYIVEEID
jgi:hypothetical protein